MGFAQKIIRNTLFNAAGKFWILGANLIIVPYLITHLGMEIYGIWVLVLVISHSYTLFDFGMSQSVIRVTSESLALDLKYVINRIVGICIALMSVIVLVVSILVLLFIPWISLNVFNIPQSLLDDAAPAFRMSLVALFIGSITNIIQSVLYGAQKMGIVNAIIVCTTTLSLLGNVVVVKFGFGLFGLVVNNIIWSGVMCVTMAVAIFKNIPDFYLDFQVFDKECWRKLFPFGFKLYVVSMTSFFMEHINKIFVSIFAGLQGVTFFDVAMKIVRIVCLPSMLLLPAIVPSASELYALKEHARLQTLYDKGLKYTAILSIPVITIAILAAHPIIEFFLNKNYGPAVLSFQILVLCYGINLFTGIGTSIARGIGMPDIEMKYALISGIINIAAVAFLGSIFGYYGIVSGLSFAVVLGSIYFFIGFNRFLKNILLIGEKFNRKSMLQIMAPSIITLSISGLLNQAGLFRENYEPMLVIIILLIYITLFMYIFFKVPLIDNTDRVAIRSALSSLLR